MFFIFYINTQCVNNNFHNNRMSKYTDEFNRKKKPPTGELLKLDIN